MVAYTDPDDPRGAARPVPSADGVSSADRPEPGVVVVIESVRSARVEFPRTSQARPVYGAPAQVLPPAGVAASPALAAVPILAELKGSPSRVEITFDRDMAVSPYPDDLAPQFTVRYSGGGLGPYTGVTVSSVSGAVVTVTITPSLPGSIPVGGWSIDFEAGPIALLGADGNPATPFDGFESEPLAL